MDEATILNQPGLAPRFIDVSCEASSLIPAAFAQYIAAEYKKWARTIGAAKIPLQE